MQRRHRHCCASEARGNEIGGNARWSRLPSRDNTIAAMPIDVDQSPSRLAARVRVDQHFRIIVM
jgi:hypothetical protein